MEQRSMHDLDDVEEADRAGRARSRLFFMMAMVFFLGQAAYFSSPEATRDALPRIGAWLLLVILMLLLIATGGFLLKPRRVRELMNDEASRLNRLAAQAMGFWATVIASLAVYVESMFDPLTFNQAIHIILTIGIGAALISFAVRERRAHRIG
jgi:hypothetical protein